MSKKTRGRTHKKADLCKDADDYSVNRATSKLQSSWVKHKDSLFFSERPQDDFDSSKENKQTFMLVLSLHG